MNSITRRRLLYAAALSSTGVAAKPSSAGTPLRLAYYDNFAPFSRLRDGRVGGIFVDIMEELLVRRLGLRVQHEAFPWARAQQRVRLGEADGFITVPTPERLVYAVAGEAWVTQGRLAMFVRAEASALRQRLQGLKSPDELAGLRLGAYLGNGWVKARFAGQEVHYSPSRQHALRMLLADRFDVLLDSANATQAALRAAGLEREVVELAPALDSNETRLMLGRHSPHLSRLPQIDAELRRMQRDGALARLSQLPPD
ncbi:amino acid ABC transporter substrate-binding protein [Roseateles sp. DAIF2]|uniref:substrate-binding periplasmic protein n=1 Tax=Roseateles sp. DAIF2 TaxID=2714952 RepID=UPI0018A2C077|nr:transporter substrate-binding domain-containing protein [Roseateles sp. DAIF2]QPF73007.1 amino acid ABC transporter substrate-binding protein [Roseateles sp. DAIF2]